MLPLCDLDVLAVLRELSGRSRDTVKVLELQSRKQKRKENTSPACFIFFKSLFVSLPSLETLVAHSLFAQCFDSCMRTLLDPPSLKLLAVTRTLWQFETHSLADCRKYLSWPIPKTQTRLYHGQLIQILYHVIGRLWLKIDLFFNERKRKREELWFITSVLQPVVFHNNWLC